MTGFRESGSYLYAETIRLCVGMYTSLSRSHFFSFVQRISWLFQLFTSMIIASFAFASMLALNLQQNEHVNYNFLKRKIWSNDWTKQENSVRVSAWSFCHLCEKRRKQIEICMRNPSQRKGHDENDARMDVKQNQDKKGSACINKQIVAANPNRAYTNRKCRSYGYNVVNRIKWNKQHTLSANDLDLLLTKKHSRGLHTARDASVKRKVTWPTSHQQCRQMPPFHVIKLHTHGALYSLGVFIWP